MNSREQDTRILTMTNNTLNQFRITTLGGRTNFAAMAPPSSGNVSGQIGVDEMVWDGNSGTIATFQDSPQLISLLNSSSRDGFACSFVA